MAKPKNQTQVPLKSLLSIGIPAFLLIIAGLVGGTYTLTTYISQQNIETLKISLGQKAKYNKDLEKKVNKLESNNRVQKAHMLPAVTLDAAGNDQSTQKVADRISELEKEMSQLTELLSEKTISSIDPNSELPVLLKQLSSEKAEERQEAITGLFVLEDPRSFVPLVTYFTRNFEEATSGNGPSQWEWNRLLFKLDAKATLQLLVNTMDSQNDYMSFVAYTDLDKFVRSIELIDTCKPYLESLALRSTYSSARTRAKVMISKLSEKRAELVEKEKRAAERGAEEKHREGERTQKEILLDIEEFIHTLTPSEN